MLLGESGEQFASVCGWDSRGEVNRPAEYGHDIIDRVRRRKGAGALQLGFGRFGRRRPDRGGVVRTNLIWAATEAGESVDSVIFAPV
ncbi:MAG: hypothetical protein ABSH56_03935 [Bryobacteraceae bacterium]